jgi:uncharacterized protein
VRCAPSASLYQQFGRDRPASTSTRAMRHESDRATARGAPPRDRTDPLGGALVDPRRAFPGARPVPIARRPTGHSCPAAHPHRRYHTFHMGYYLLEYALIDDYLARRAAFREAHLALAREAHRRGDLILAGALAEPTDRAVLVWRTGDRSVIERFIDNDPYVHNGLVTSWTIRPWTVVIGEGAKRS